MSDAEAKMKNLLSLGAVFVLCMTAVTLSGSKDRAGNEDVRLPVPDRIGHQRP